MGDLEKQTEEVNNEEFKKFDSYENLDKQNEIYGDNGYFENGTEETHEELSADELAYEMMTASSSRYVNVKDKYEDAKSTAATLLIVGIGGLLVIIGSVTKITDKIYKLPFDIKSQWMMYIVMTVLFIIFTIIGVAYVFKTKEYKNMIAKEDDDYKKVYKWIDEELSVDDNQVGIDENTNEAEVYFKRTAYLKDQLMRRFEDVDEALADKIIDEKYDEIFAGEED